LGVLRHARFDYRRDQRFKILSILHVPRCADGVMRWVFMMLVASLIWLESAGTTSARVAAKAAARRHYFDLIALITGASGASRCGARGGRGIRGCIVFNPVSCSILAISPLWRPSKTRHRGGPDGQCFVLVGVGLRFAVRRYAVKFWNPGSASSTSVPLATGGRTVSDVFFLPVC